MSRKEDVALFHSDLPLSPVLSLYARVVTVKDIKRGECAGYGRAYTAPHDGTITNELVSRLSGRLERVMDRAGRPSARDI